MSIITSTLHRHNELEYEMSITKGSEPCFHDILIEYTGRGPEPVTFTTRWDAVGGWTVQAQLNQSGQLDSPSQLRSYVEELQTAAEMATEFQEVLRGL